MPGAPVIYLISDDRQSGCGEHGLSLDTWPSSDSSTMGWEGSPVVEGLPGMHKVLGSALLSQGG